MKLRNGTLEEAGILPGAVTRIKTSAESWVKEGSTLAVVLLAARKGVIFLHEAFGQLTPEEDSPKLRKSALFPLASLTKPITATAVMIRIRKSPLLRLVIYPFPLSFKDWCRRMMLIVGHKSCLHTRKK